MRVRRYRAVGLPCASDPIMNLKRGSAMHIFVTGVKPQFMAIEQKIREIGQPHFAWIIDANIQPENENDFRTWVNFRPEPERLSPMLKNLNRDVSLLFRSNFRTLMKFTLRNLYQASRKFDKYDTSLQSNGINPKRANSFLS